MNYCHFKNGISGRLNVSQNSEVRKVLDTYKPKGLVYLNTYHDIKVNFSSLFNLHDIDKANLFNELKGKGIATMDLETVVNADFSSVKTSLGKYGVAYSTKSYQSYTNFIINFNSFANLSDANKVNLLNELRGKSQDLYLR